MKSIKIREFLLNRILIIVILACFFVGLSIALTSTYGYDNDTYRMFNTFLNIIHNGVYIPSRSPGSPVPEIGIGTLAWFGGSKLTNSFTLIIYFLSILLFPFCFKKKPKYSNYLLFASLCFSSPLLLFENTHSIDYSWGLLFFTLGSLIKFRFKYNFLSIIFFVLAIGSRCIYVLYLFPLILFNSNDETEVKINQKLSFLLTTLFCCSLLYIPVWFQNSLNLDWITAHTPDDEGIFGLVARFIYKNIMNFGLIQFLIILFVFFKNTFRENIKIWLIDNKFLSLIGIIFLNLIVFFKIPGEPMYLQITVVSIFFILAFGFNRNPLNFSLILTIIFLNIFSWFQTVDFLKITYKDDNPCGQHAIAARPSLFLKSGKLDWLKKRNELKYCYVDVFKNIKNIDYREKILNGDKLKK